jgi:hypothetical protein
VRVVPERRNSCFNPLTVDQRWERFISWLGSEPDVDGHDLAATVASEQCAALDATEAQRDIGANRIVVLSRRRVETAGNVERHHGGA